MSLLEVCNLIVDLPTAAGWIRVNDVSFQLAPAASLGLVGESGSGKTMLALALMGLLPPGERVAGTAVLERGVADEKNLVQLSEKAWRRVRGREIAMIFQEPMTSLNPVMRIGAQIQEAVRTHELALSRDEVCNRVVEALRHASVPEPEVRAEQFPHQLSGGLRQRDDRHGASCRAKIADCRRANHGAGRHGEKQILDLLDRLRCELKLGLVQLLCEPYCALRTGVNHSASKMPALRLSGVATFRLSPRRSDALPPPGVFCEGGCNLFKTKAMSFWGREKRLQVIDSKDREFSSPRQKCQRGGKLLILKTANPPVRGRSAKEAGNYCREMI